MNSSALIQFSSKSTIAEILDELMVEKWSWSLTYEDYFEECHTLQCSYTVLTRNDAIYIVTTVISVIGGLATVSWAYCRSSPSDTTFAKRTLRIEPM